jgi:hypothetical protein
MGQRRAVGILPAIVMMIVMVVAMSRGHVEVTMVPMPVSLADGNADDIADLNSDVLRDDNFCRQRSKSRRMPAPLGEEQQEGLVKYFS